MSRKSVIGILIAVIIAAAAVTIGIMSGGRNRVTITTDLYFFNEEETAIAAETREISYDENDDVVQAVVEALIKGPENPRRRRTVHKDVKLLSIDRADPANIIVNFSREYETGDTTKDILSTYAVVKSLCALDGISSVKVIIEGSDIVAPDGAVIGYLTNEDINLPTDTNTTETRNIKLYFTQRGTNKLYGEMRTIRVADQQPIEQYIINELIKGPQAEGLSATLSSETTLIGVDTIGDVCFVNFGSNFAERNSGDQEKEILAVYSIVDSLTELDTINRVQFFIDGKKVDMFGTLNINSMFGRNQEMIAE